ncbi:MAG: NAD(P)H-binding protein [Pontixanthobacter sp.]
MSEPMRIALVGATGLVGRAVVEAAVGRPDLQLVAIARHAMPLPHGARMELLVADTDGWADALERSRARVLISALGTTWKQSGRSEANFRAVDRDLVLDTARAAHSGGVKRMVAISSIGADAEAKGFYLRVKGEVERDLRTVGFDRTDILRPGLLRGQRNGDRRWMERLGIAVSPVTDLMLQGRLRKYRSIRDAQVAQAALTFAMRKADGNFVHEHDAIASAARQFAPPE